MKLLESTHTPTPAEEPLPAFIQLSMSADESFMDIMSADENCRRQARGGRKRTNERRLPLFVRMH